MIDPVQIIELRQSVGWEGSEEGVWRQCLEQSLTVVSEFDGDKLVGIGFVSGNARHAQRRPPPHP